MKTIAPNINIAEAEEPMEVEDFQVVKQPAFASDLQETNWEELTGISAVCNIGCEKDPFQFMTLTPMLWDNCTYLGKERDYKEAPFKYT